RREELDARRVDQRDLVPPAHPGGAQRAGIPGALLPETAIGDRLTIEIEVWPGRAERGSPIQHLGQRRCGHRVALSHDAPRQRSRTERQECATAVPSAW